MTTERGVDEAIEIDVQPDDQTTTKESTIASLEQAAALVEHAAFDLAGANNRTTVAELILISKRISDISKRLTQ